MVFNFRNNKTQGETAYIDTQEAFNLWDILTSKYDYVEKLSIFQQVAHDSDLKVIIKYYLDNMNTDISKLEKEIERYSIKGPKANISNLRQPSNPELYYDQQIAREIFLFHQEHIENLLRVLRSTTTNDSIRQLIHHMAIQTVEREDKIIAYLKFKGWIQTPPIYHDIPKNVPEKLTTCEAYHIWDFLTVRYDNLRQTQIYSSFAFDGDFRKLLEMGIAHLNKQISILEKELQHFGIPFPQKPAKTAVTPDNTEVFDDDHMFRIIIMGIQSASIIHAQALKQSTFNDRIRTIFKNLLLEEVQLQDKMYKFGKLKGWFNAVPSYRET